VISEAQYTNEEQTSVRIIMDGHELFVPVSAENRHWLEIQEWVAGGGSIAAYVAPPVPERTTQTIHDHVRIEGNLSANGVFPPSEPISIATGNVEELIAIVVRLGLAKDVRV